MTSLQTKNRRLITFLLITGIIIGYLLNEGKQLVFPSNDKVTIDSLQVRCDSLNLRHFSDSCKISNLLLNDSCFRIKLGEYHVKNNGVVFDKKVKK